MFVKGFDNSEEMEKYYNKDTNTYVFKENGSYIDLVMLNFDLKVSAHIDAGNIIANDINAYNVDAINIDARNITAHDITALDINTYKLKAEDIDAGNIIASDIVAKDIYYFAVCVAYKSLKCRSIKGKRKNAKYLALDETVEVENDK